MHLEFSFLISGLGHFFFFFFFATGMFVHAHARCTPDYEINLFPAGQLFCISPTRGRRSCASLAHPLVLHYGCRGCPASPCGGHLGQSPLLLPTTPGHQEEPAVSGLSQLFPVLPVF